MALKSNLTADDIRKYGAETADFAFELKVLNRLSALQWKCEHSGTYLDPVTGKPREFDIRAMRERGHYRWCLSVECKNFSRDFPLVGICVKRRDPEAFHELLIGSALAVRENLNGARLKRMGGRSNIVEVSSPLSIYRVGDTVAKSIDQVGIELITTGRGETQVVSERVTAVGEKIFEKTSQALNSLFDLIARGHKDDDHERIYCFFPLLVVPESCLWVINYDDAGNVVGDPLLVKHVSRFLNQEWDVGTAESARSFPFRISHIDIVTYDHLENFLFDSFERTYDDRRAVFPDMLPPPEESIIEVGHAITDEYDPDTGF